MEKDGVVLFTTATNSRLNSSKSKCGVYIDGNVRRFIGISSLHSFCLFVLFSIRFQEASGIDYLVQSYPNYVSIASIPLQGDSLLDKARLIA